MCPAATVAGNNAALPICAAREGTVRKREKEEETASKVATVFGEMSDDSIINNCERTAPSIVYLIPSLPSTFLHSRHHDGIA